jgi:hypothetical protein
MGSIRRVIAIMKKRAKAKRRNEMSVEVKRYLDQIIEINRKGIIAWNENEYLLYCALEPHERSRVAVIAHELVKRDIQRRSKWKSENG